MAAVQVALGMGQNPLTKKEFSEQEKQYLQAVMTGAYSAEYKDGKATGNYVLNEAYADTATLSKTMSQKDYDMYRQIATYANSQVSMMQGQCQAMQANYENQVSIWLDYQKEQLDAQQEWEMDLLAEEQQDYEMEKTCIESELELIKERKQAIEQQLGEAIKDSAPKFGLA